MTVTLGDIRADVGPTNRHQIADITGPASYLTGGETLVPADFRMGKLFMLIGGISNGTIYLAPFYVVATGKLIWISSATGAQVANATNLSGYTGRVLAIGL